ncbi:PAS domain-containing protein [Jannaschia faecimaris]|nr:PAS domain-containing protein [Jannaschia faecimaris]
MRKSPLLEQAWRYWTSQRLGTGLPRRAALDPKEMGPILGHSMVLDRLRAGNVRVRLGGHVMSQLMGMEVRGLPVRAFFDLTDRTRVMDQIEQVFERPATLEFDLISEGADGIVTGRMLILPLLDSAGQVTKALAVMVTDRIATDPPRRFQLTHSTLIPVVGTARRDPAAEPQRRMTDHSLPVEIQAGMAEQAVPFQGKPSVVPWLRVVK